MDFGELIKLINNIWPYLCMFGGILYGWLQKRYALPKIVIQALSAMESAGITQQAIGDVIERIAQFTEMSDSDKQTMAREELQHIASLNGIELSDSTANLILEWVYKRFKVRGKAGTVKCLQD